MVSSVCCCCCARVCWCFVPPTSDTCCVVLLFLLVQVDSHGHKPSNHITFRDNMGIGDPRVLRYPVGECRTGRTVTVFFLLHYCCSLLLLLLLLLSYDTLHQGICSVRPRLQHVPRSSFEAEAWQSRQAQLSFSRTRPVSKVPLFLVLAVN